MSSVAGRLARNVAWLGVGEVVLKGALFAAGAVVARGLGRDAMGAFTVAYGAAMMLMLLLTAGQVEVVIRETARRPETARGLSRLSRAWQQRVALVAVPVSVAAAAFVPDGALRWTLIAFVPYAWFRSALISRGAVFKGLDRMEVEVGGRSTELGSALVLLTLLASVSAPVWTSGLAFSVGAAAGVGVVMRSLRKLPPGAGSELDSGYLAREGATFLVLNLGLQAMLRIDTFILAGLGVGKERIGLYGVAAAPVWGLLGVAQLIAVAAYPTLAKAATDGALSVRRVVTLALAGGVIGTLLATMITVVKVPLIRMVFGPQYLESTQLVAVLAWVLPGACLDMLMGIVVAACGRQRWSLAPQVFILLMAAGGDLVAIPRWGLAGCAGVAVAVWSAGTLVAMTVAILAVRAPRRTAASVPPAVEPE